MITLLIGLNDSRKTVEIAEPKDWAFMSQKQRADIINQSIVNAVNVSVTGEISKSEALRIEIKGVESTLSEQRKVLQDSIDSEDFSVAGEVQSRIQHLEQVRCRLEDQLAIETN